MGTLTNIPESGENQQMPDADDRELIAALMGFAYRYRGLLPVTGGSLLLVMGLGFIFMAALLKDLAILYPPALFLLVIGYFSIRSGRKVLRQECACYRSLLKGNFKTVVTGRLRALGIADQDHEYEIGDLKIRVWIPLGSKKFFKYDSYYFRTSDCIPGEEIALHFFTLPNGKNILLKALCPSFPGQALQKPVTDNDRRSLAATSGRMVRLFKRGGAIFLAVLFVFASIAADGDLELWGSLTAVLLLIGVILYLVIHQDARTDRKRRSALQQKTEVSGVITQTGIIRYSVSARNSLNYTLIIIGGRWYVLGFEAKAHCGEKVRFSFADNNTKAIPVQLITNIERIQDETVV
ncbi:hypothetical protein A8C56_20975 [Niabella ginsenosidivorans]|uniref:Uncharacterized protein n=1 Tax=Niabella ginsenosidivorans TaxID=1176587 RepID=A0A1A9I8X8_9BACT|nr:hypothetical protein [Niabella ginsenosidivorans]ANH83122.1 hypothetical protein A8C56_20975 [Niabella ginsenosidivorans]